MENSDFNSEPLDSPAVMEELDRKRLRLLYRATILVFAPLSYFPLVILLFPEIEETMFLAGLVIAVMIIFTGFVLFAIGSTWSAYIRGIRILQRISPPHPVVTEAYAVARIENTFAFILRSAPYALYFVCFSRSESIPASKINVPKNFWRWDSVLHVGGLRVHNLSGMFSVPTPEQEFLSGEGTLLALPIRGSSYMLYVPEFSRDQLLAAADYASRLTSGEYDIDWNSSSRIA
jgi:uncharacterized membrane protein (DUF485 family)